MRFAVRSKMHESQHTLRARRMVSAALTLAMLLALVPVFPTSAGALTATTPVVYPRIGAWYPSEGSASAVAKYDLVALMSSSAGNVPTYKSLNPGLVALSKISASEIVLYANQSATAASNLQAAAASPRWVLTQVGSTLTAAITAGQTTLNVTETSKSGLTLFRVGDILIVDNEYMKVQAISGTTLTVQRNIIGTGAAHSSGARVAAAISSWPNSVMMDLSEQCPKVDVGAGPEDWAQFNARWGAANAASPWDGVFIDMAKSNIASRHIMFFGYAPTIDVDRSNTVVSDYTAFDASWNRGLLAFGDYLRARLPDKIIQANAALPNYDAFNGNMFETFPRPTDDEKAWTRRMRFDDPHVGSVDSWQTQSLAPKASAILSYEDAGSAWPAAPDYRKMRFGLTTSLMSDAFYQHALSSTSLATLKWFDEYDNAGAGRGYLGQALGAAASVVPPLTTPDLLGGNGAFDTATQVGAFNLNVLAGAATKVVDTSVKDSGTGSVRVNVTASGGSWDKITLSRSVTLGSGDHTLRFRARADRKLPVWAKVQAAASPWTTYWSTGEMWLDTQWKTYEIPCTSTAANTIANFMFGMGGQVGTVWIDDMKLQAGTRGVYRRDFQNGIALVNPTKSSATVSLGGTFRKINGAQAPAVNDGSLVTAVTIPPQDGLILLRTSAPTPAPQAPTAVVSATPVAGTAPMTVNFSGSGSSDADGSIASYAWDFGDGTSGSGLTTSHIYGTAGTYTARLTVTDATGLTGTATIGITVSAPAQAPRAVVAATPTSGTAPMTVNFSGSGSSDADGSIASYAWDFGDGTSGSGLTASHVYGTAGTYTARLTVTDSTGLTGTATVSVRVAAAPQAPRAVAAVTPAVGIAPLSVTFDGGGSTDADGSIVSYAWDFGDGTSGSGRTAGHLYAAAGTYTARLTVRDSTGLTASTIVTVRVDPAPQAPRAVAAASPASGPAPLAVTFDGRGSTDPDGSIVSYAWDFGDGSSGVGPNASHAYAAAGTYTARLTVTDSTGLTGTASVIVTVLAPDGPPAPPLPPVAEPAVTATSGIAPLAVTFDGSLSSDLDGTIVSWAWDFGDGTFGEGPSARHTYAEGTYAARLTVTDSQGLSATREVTIKVEPRSIRVARIVLTVVPTRRGTVARANVVLTDSEGLPVPDAHVTGQWRGATVGSDTVTTDVNGEALFESRRLRKRGTVWFEVQTVHKPGYAYDPWAGLPTDQIEFTTSVSGDSASEPADPRDPVYTAPVKIRKSRNLI